MSRRHLVWFLLSLGAVVAALIFWPRPAARTSPTWTAAPVADKVADKDRPAAFRPGAPIDIDEEPVLSAASIEGRVLDPRGNPVAGATVLVGGRSGRAQPRVTRTAADGSFRFANMPEGRYAVSASAPGFVGVSRSEVQPVEGMLARPLELRLTDGGFLLSGRLLDAGGGPIPGGRVRVRSSAMSRDEKAPDVATFETEADGDGRYAFRLLPARVHLTAEASGYVTAGYVFFLEADEARDVVLQPAARLSGRVVEGSQRQPAARAQVQAVPLTGMSGMAPPVRTDEEGRFHFPAVSPGSYRLLARRGGQVGELPKPVVVLAAARIDDLEVVLTEGLRLDGTVKSASHEPIADAELGLMPSQFRPGMGAPPARTDAAGHFLIEGLYPGDYRLTVRADGYAPVAEQVKLTRSERREVVLGAGARVEGIVRDADDRPVEGAIITAGSVGVPPQPSSHDSAVTDEEGKFTLARLGPGKLNVTAVKGEQTAQVEALPLLVGQTTRVTLRLGEAPRVSGVVRWDDGRPAGQVRVLSGPMAMPGRLVQTRTAPDGSFTLGPLRPGKVDLLAHDGQGPVTFSGDGPEQARVTLASGEHKRGVTLTLSRRTGRIAGRVTDARGEPIAGVQVIASQARPGLPSHAAESQALSAPDGTFTLERLRPAPHTVRASHPDHPDLERRQVAPGTNDLQLRFGPP